MIEITKLTPQNYSTESRDWQLICHVFDAVFNRCKTDIDLMYFNPLDKNCDKRFLDLTAKTLGFDSKHEYNVDNLYSLCTCFQSIMKYKGTYKAIDDCIKLLLRAQNIKSNYNLTIINKDRNNNNVYEVQISISNKIEDSILLEDMLDYILPVGYTYNIIYITAPDTTFKTSINMKNNPVPKSYDDVSLSKLDVATQTYTGVVIGNQMPQN